MRIADLETFAIANPPPSFGGSYFVVVKLTTDDGIVGVGEAYGATFRPAVVRAAIADLADHYLIGEDPHHIERFWRRSYSRGFTQRPDVSLAGPMSALEMACWDIVGKAADRPVYELLGGRVHERLRSYTYLYRLDGDTGDVYLDPDAAAARAVEEVERGFTAVKFDPAGPYTVMGGHQPPLEWLDRASASPGRSGRRWATAPTSSWGPTANSPRPGRCAWRDASSRTTRCGFEEPVPPTTLPRWPRSRRRRRCRSRPESA